VKASLASAAHLGLLAALHGVYFDESWDQDAIAGLLATPGAFALIMTDGADEEAFAGQAQDLGAGELFLEVAEDNGAALALYAGAGFVQVGRRQGYYQGAGGARAALVLRSNPRPS
jgi:ribosomal-protein-alanine N-acetyltransferase|tara:strand:- start:112 stop:459 length:348 start_codon:yes stop_codon:yes gene_type:complete